MYFDRPPLWERVAAQIVAVVPLVGLVYLLARAVATGVRDAF